MTTSVITPTQDILDSIIPEEFYRQYLQNIKPASKGELKALCPFHNEKTPSFQFNRESGRFRCFGCNASGHYAEFLMGIHNCTRDEAMDMLRKDYGTDIPTTQARKPRETKPEPEPEPLNITIEQVMGYQKNLWTPANEKKLQYLIEHRGLTEDTINANLIGTNGSRYTFPVFDDTELINLRYYKPKPGPDEKKWLNTTGAELSLYPRPPQSDNVLICEGELDTLVAIQQGFDAVTQTGGSGYWKSEWNEYFRGKSVTIAYDNDEAGRNGAEKLADILAEVALGVRILQWPDNYPEKGDVTDWFVNLNLTIEYFQQLIDEGRVIVKARVVEKPVGNGALEHQKALLENALPDDGFLKRYVKYATEVTDAPEVFHLFSGLTALAATVAPEVKLEYGNGFIHPNIWCVLIAKSSLFRKSTSVAIANKLLWQVNAGVVLPNEFTPEVLTANMASQPNGIFIWPEIKNALKTLNRSYMEGTKEFLTEVYDVPEVYRRKLRQSEFIIKNPTLSILAATTIDWLVESIKGGDITGGFCARFIYVPAMAKTRDMALPPVGDVLQRNEVAKALNDCKEVKGLVDISYIRRMYEDWYYSTIAELQTDENSETLSGFYTRLAIYALKIAMLIEVSKTQTLVITTETMKQTFAIIEYLKQSIRYLIAREFHVTKEAKQLEALYRIVESKGQISYRDLLQRAHDKAENVKPILATLVQSGRLEQHGNIYCLPGVSITLTNPATMLTGQKKVQK